MAKRQDGTGLFAKVGVLTVAVALLPALFAFSYLRDDSSAETKVRSDRVAARDAQYRQMMVDALDRRLGNPER